MTAQQQRDATLDAIVAWLIEMAERTPVLMAWEDLHWADPTTLETLGMLIEQAPTAAMLVVATYRPELTPPWPQRSHMIPITLNRLERPEVETMVGHLAGGRPLPGEVVDHIVAKADGVPLYVEELTKAILGSGVLEARGDIYVLTGALAQLHIPETLQDSLMARLDRAPRLREVAQLGSVLGREFAYDMISALAGIEEDMLQSGLGQLVVDELLYQRGRPPRSRYLFKHALIQDAAYQSLAEAHPPAISRAGSKAAGGSLSRGGEHATGVGGASLHRSELSGAGDRILAQSRRRRGEPSRRTSKRSTSFAEVWRWSKRYPIRASGPSGSWICKWRLVPPWSRPRATATPTSAEPMRGHGSSVGNSRIIPASSRRSAACSSTMRALIEMEKSQHFAEEAMRVAERLDDAARLVGAHVALGVTLFWQGRLEPALAHFRRGFEMFDPNMQFPDWPSSHPGVQCQFFPMLISWMLGYPDRSLDELRTALGSAETLGHPLTLAQTLCWVALVHIFRHEPPAAADYAGSGFADLRGAAHRAVARVCPLRGWMGARRLWRKREGAGPNCARSGRLTV